MTKDQKNRQEIEQLRVQVADLIAASNKREHDLGNARIAFQKLETALRDRDDAEKAAARKEKLAAEETARAKAAEEFEGQMVARMDHALAVVDKMHDGTIGDAVRAVAFSYALAVDGRFVR